MQERAPDRLTDEEVEQVCALPEPYGFLARVLVQTGLRWGELIRASTADIGHLAFMPYTADYFFYTSPDAP